LPRAAIGHEADRGQPGDTGWEARRAPDGTDAALLQACASGDARAFRVLFERYQPLLTRFFFHLLGSREDAEEAVVDTFVRVWRGASCYRGEASVRTWLYRIAHRIALDTLRRRTRRPRVESTLLPEEERDARLSGEPAESDPAALLVAGFERAQDRETLHLALSCLPPSDRTLIALFYFEGWSYGEIVAVRGESLPRVKGLLYRARQRLKAHFLRLRNGDEDLDMLADAPPDSALDSGSLFAL
jgi:RNA polymerase sigma-70 factor (ECF subfamily)